MSIRTKTKKRLLILLSAALIVIALGATLYVWRQGQIHKETAEHRAAGIAAVKAKDYSTGLEELGQFYKREKNDAEATYYLGLARMHVELPDGKHIGAALGLFQRVLQIDPDYTEAQRHVMDIDLMFNFNPDAIEIANKLLAKKADDLDALHVKTIALIRTRKFDEALKVTQTAAKSHPEDLQNHIYALLVMQKLDQPNDKLIEYATQLREKHPDKPRFQILQGNAYLLAHDHANAVKWIKKAAEGTPPDAEFARTMVNQLSGVGLFNDSLQYLDDHVSQFPKDEQLERMYARRLWENSRFDDVVKALKDLKADDADAPSDLLAIKAMAMLHQKKNDEAKAIITSLDSRKGDNAAAAWVKVLREVSDGKPQSVKEVVKVCRDAVATDSGDPYLRNFLAEAQAQQGENELALDQWQEAARRAPEWALPYIRMASVYASTHRLKQAVEAARNGVARAPRNGAAFITFADVSAQLIESGQAKPEEEKQLMSMLEAIQKTTPGEPYTLPIYAELLARSGDTAKAKTVIVDALNNTKHQLDERGLLRLAGISRKYKLGVSDQCYAQLEKTKGMNVSLAYARATQIASKQGTDAALKYFQPLVEKAGAKDMNWQIAWGKFLDDIGDPRAAKTWVAIGDQNPNNSNIQRMILGIRSVQGDRDFMDRTIDRVKKLSGDEGMTWQLARARWLLTGDGGSRDATKAVSLLNDIVHDSPDLVEPHILLATALEQLDNLSGAVDQLNAATNLQPNNDSIKIGLAKLQLKQGDVDTASQTINAVLTDKGLNDRQNADIALLLSKLGRIDDAMKILEKLPPNLLLAELDIRQNRLSDAEDVYKKLMQSPTPQVVQAYSNLLGATGRTDEGLQVLAHLKTMNLKPGVLAMVQGEFYRRFVGVDEAMKFYDQATKDMPENPLPWRTIIDQDLQAGNFDKAMEVNDKALAAVPGDKVFSLLKSQREVIQAVDKTARLRPLIRAIVMDEDNRDTALVVLRTIKQASDEQQPMSTVLLNLRQLADKHPQFEALQLLVVDTYAAVGRYEDAVDLATRTMEAFPNDDDPASRATRLLMQLGRWNEALSMAQQWRQRSLTRPIDADMAIAQNQLKLDDPKDALKQIDRYVSIAMQHPTNLPGVIAVYAQALIHSGDINKASEILKPLIPTHPRWRGLWMQLAMNDIKDPAVTAAWLERAGKVIPDGSVSERIALADNWFTLGHTANNQAYQKKGVEELKSLAYADKPDADAVVAYAIVEYQLGDLDAAAKEYRRALQINPNQDKAQNNLAILIADAHGDLKEALTLAKAVVESHPRVATFHDTLAHVYSAMKDYSKAADSLREAIKLDPESIEWRVNLLQAMVSKGDRDGAKKVLAEIDALNPDVEHMPKALRSHLDRLRQSLNSEASAQAPTP